MEITNETTKVDEDKLQQLLGKIMTDVGGTVSSVLVYIADKLGLYRAMAEFGKPISSSELAEKTNTFAVKAGLTFEVSPMPGAIVRQ